MNCLSDFFTYETTKSVVVKSWTIGLINRAVQLLIISYFVGWVFLHEKAYQVRDTAIESSVVTKVKGFGRYANRVMDVSDYVTPPQGTSVFVIITKMIVTENQMQGFCPESEEKFHCADDGQCAPGRFAGGGILTGRCVNYSSELRSCEVQGWCPTEVDTVERPIMAEAENFTIFIKNSIRFPLFNFEKGNLLPNLTENDVKTCRFHPARAPFCPILRVGDVVRFAGQDFAKLARTVSTTLPAPPAGGESPGHKAAARGHTRALAPAGRSPGHQDRLGVRPGQGLGAVHPQVLLHAAGRRLGEEQRLPRLQLQVKAAAGITLQAVVSRFCPKPENVMSHP
ncbi:PREDICTED: P2X purinoceptor 3 isoform X3 [Chinchilla lanigera]|uniref:P2X purinoceptor 3 isoform X3 n=1 Tax=Chinchilla lanigera TaxID=34839 RepID=UPI00038EA120|nr:PREDICTED: P2X purinoceptor 3 isoform X3 [Chinchilla lanigera]